MSISDTFSRVTSYFARHGLAATLRRASIAAKRAIFARCMVVFYCDLAKQAKSPARIPNSMKLERLNSATDVGPQDLQKMTSFWNPKKACGNIRERFEHGATLWTAKSGEKLAGYGWTLRGGTIEPHYFPLAKHDLHLFDSHVFPEYRGQGINPLLVNHILHTMSSEGIGRAFIEAAEWNEAQLASLRKTPFRRLGWARKSTVFHRAFVCWDQTKTEQAENEAERGSEHRKRAGEVNL